MIVKLWMSNRISSNSVEHWRTCLNFGSPINNWCKRMLYSDLVNSTLLGRRNFAIVWFSQLTSPLISLPCYQQFLFINVLRVHPSVIARAPDLVTRTTNVFRKWATLLRNYLKHVVYETYRLLIQILDCKLFEIILDMMYVR